jgi:hypothetical protein
MTNLPTTGDWDAQVFLVETLKGFPPLSNAIGGRVYDGSTPARGVSDMSGPIFPYVLLDGWNSLPRNVMNRMGLDLTCMVHIFSDYKGTKEVNSIAALIEMLLNHPAPAFVENWYIEFCRIEQRNIIVEGSEGEEPLRHMILRVRLYLKAKETR